MKINEIVPISYLTTYALSKGIIKLENLHCSVRDSFNRKNSDEIAEHDDVYLSNHEFLPYKMCIYAKLGQDIFLKREDAIAKAEKMREKSIVMAERRIAKLKNMKFDNF